MNYSSSWTQICNRALGRLGAHDISDLEDGSKDASYCNTYLGDAIEEVLAQWNWKSCRKRVRLAPDENRPAFGYAYQFSLPVDLIRIVEVYNTSAFSPSEHDRSPYEIEGAYILSDYDELEIVYIARPVNPDKLSAGVRRAIYTSLAALLATPLTSNEQLIALIAAEKTQSIERAKIEDAQMSYDPLLNGELWYEDART